MRDIRLKGIAAAMMLLISSGAQALDQVEGVYQIASAQDMADFALLVNAGQTNLNAVLTADVDLDGVEGLTFRTFSGTFDGQGHTIRNYTYTATGADQGLFGTLSGATIRDFAIDGTLTLSGDRTGLIGKSTNSTISGIRNNMDVIVTVNKNNGGFVGKLESGTIDCCEYSGNLTLTHNSSGSLGGIAGWCTGGSITNCLFSGHIKVTVGAYNLGGIASYSSSGNFVVHGCLSTGTFEGDDLSNVRAVIACVESGCNADKLTGNFMTANSLTTAVKGGRGSDVTVTVATPAMLASGEVCYKLNAHNASPKWFQAIGTDAMPTFAGSAVVYEVGAKNCDGSAKPGLFYTNTEGKSFQDEHLLDEDGICTACHQLEQDVDGYYKVPTGKALKFVAGQVNSGTKKNWNLRFTADLDLSGENWTPIGNDTYKFEGNVDGGFHTISNMVVDLGATKCAGLFGTVTRGTIKNFVIDNTCSVSSTEEYVGGLIGHTTGNSTVNVEGIGVMCNVTGGKNMGGIVGNANAGNICNIRRCFTTGAISSGQSTVACFSGWEGSVGAVVEDCWSISTVNKAVPESYLARSGETFTLRNCYSVNGTQGTIIQSEDVASGRLAWLLNGQSSDNPTWFQTLGEDEYPTLVSTHETVYFKNGTYTNGTADAIVNIREEVGDMVCVTDMQGRMVRPTTPATHCLTGLPAGTYILKGATKARKVMVK